MTVGWPGILGPQESADRQQQPPFQHEKSSTELTPGESYTQIAWGELRPQQEEGFWGPEVLVSQPQPLEEAS